MFFSCVINSAWQDQKQFVPVTAWWKSHFENIYGWPEILGQLRCQQAITKMIISNVKAIIACGK